jgi:AraC family transcriptional regulator, carnitine catabolism transcriptional activator
VVLRIVGRNGRFVQVAPSEPAFWSHAVRQHHRFVPVVQDTPRGAHVACNCRHAIDEKRQGFDTAFVIAATSPLLPAPIGFVLIPQFASIALASAIEPLRIANRYLRNAYRWKLLSLDGHPVADGNGITVQPHGGVFDEAALGTVIICADVQPERHYSRELRRWLHQQNAAGAALGALDTGCFLLARAGLLDGCRVTMHWEVLEAFRERFARTIVAQTLFELDGRRLTCAGGTAAIDMVLEAIARDHGSELAARVAEHCLHERIRPGGAAQRMAPATRGRIHHPALAQAVALLEATPERSVSVPELAEHAGLSTRQLLRLFAQFAGVGPGRYHRRLRLEHARGLLRYTALAVTDAAVAAGFESLAHFCRAYRQQYGVSPGADRQTAPRGAPLVRDRSVC